MPAIEKLRKNLMFGATCAGIGVLLYAVGWAQTPWLSILVSLGVGFTIRYGKILLNRVAPRMPLPLQYLLAALFAVGLWGLLPLSFHYWQTSGLSRVSLDDYLTELAIICVVTPTVCYYYYSREHALLLKQALDQAELTRIRKEKEMLQMRLRLLKSQIEPHFLFNTLANVQALIAIEPKKASRMLAALTALLRGSLDSTRRKWLTLGDELAFNREYLVIQQIRLGDRLRVRFDMADDVRDDMPFPPLLLQPLIENAVVHGIEPLRGGGELQVNLAIRDEHLVVHMRNDCPVSPHRNGHRGHHVGLSNIRERLHRLYGEAASFSYRKQTPQGVLVTMEIPLHDGELASPDRG